MSQAGKRLLTSAREARAVARRQCGRGSVKEGDMNRAEFKKQADDAMMAATRDAAALGVGFVRILSDGTIERLDPKGIWLDPPSEAEQSK